MNMRSALGRVTLLLLSLTLGACATTESGSQPPVVYHTLPEKDTDQAIQPREDALRVMTLNMAHARGTGFNQMFQGTHTARSNLNSIAQQIRQAAPDVVSLQEADRQSFWNGNFDHVSFLAEQVSFGQSVRGSHVSSLGLDYGTALVANLDLYDPVSLVFNPSEPAGSKGFVVSTVRWPGKQCVEVDVVSVHLDFSSREIRLEQVAELVSVLKHRNRPVILMGDFNADWQERSSAVREIVDELQLHTYQPFNEALVTFPKFKRRLDWILVSQDIEFRSFQVSGPMVSDHLGLVSELGIKRACG